MMINIIYAINIMKYIYHIVKNVKLIYVHYAKDIKNIKEYYMQIIYLKMKN